jgi:hypothetical protein
VLRTINLFEHKNVLGHRVRWAWDKCRPIGLTNESKRDRKSQLLVIPRAGEWANAFYQRESRSLQFFFFRPDRAPGEFVYTCLSRDIVAHETAHAILDGIDPDLYDALTPQALALHEAVADLTAVFMAAESGPLVTDVFEKTRNTTRGRIDDSTIFSSIAPQFGSALDQDGKAKYLRQLANQKTLRDVAGDEPHELSEVLSGALFTVLIKMYDERRERFVRDARWKDRTDPLFACSGAAFAAACFRLRNAIFQALEYLPPGEVSFADYGRAILAVDEGGNLNREFVRDWIREEFLRRGIVAKLDELATDVNFIFEPLRNIDLMRLVEDDKLARSFAETHRDFLEIPPGVEFHVRPRDLINKTYYNTERKEVPAKECLVKVSWNDVESNEGIEAIDQPREILRGTTLVIDLSNRKVRAKLTSDRTDNQRGERDRMFKRLLESGLLARDEQACAPDGSLLDLVVRVDTASGRLQIHGTAQLLHIVE